MSGAAAQTDAARIDALLPQTQCTRCGYPGCQPYAEAVACGKADINQCPPGGSATIRALAELLGRPAKPLNPANGREAPPQVAWIDESRCIGCARCLPACPVDAIIGAQRYLHTVLERACNGCELCIASCPVDCISMRPRDCAAPAPAPEQNRRHYEAHRARARRRHAARSALLAERKRAAQPPDALPSQ